MFYYLSLYYIQEFSFLNIFKYLTFRSGGALLTSLIISFLFAPIIINWLKKNQKNKKTVREDLPNNHLVKKIGTPTMGGLLILTGLFSGIFLWGDLLNPIIWFLIFIVASFGFLGAYDDYKKIKFKNSSGVSFKFKIISQISIATIGIVIFSYFSVLIRILHFL